jgi:hypothetical protein
VVRARLLKVLVGGELTHNRVLGVSECADLALDIDGDRFPCAGCRIGQRGDGYLRGGLPAGRPRFTICRGGLKDERRRLPGASVDRR